MSSSEKILQQMRTQPADVRFADLKKVCEFYWQYVKKDHFTYRVTWSKEDDEHVGLCAEFPSLSWLAPTPEAALAGIRKTVSEVVSDMERGGEDVPAPLAERTYSGQFKVRIPPQVHRALVLQAAEEGISLNRLASAKLST